jgi:hypothetical protein
MGHNVAKKKRVLFGLMNSHNSYYCGTLMRDVYQINWDSPKTLVDVLSQPKEATWNY